MIFRRVVLAFLILLSFGLAADVNFDKLVAEAKKSNKYILVYLHISGCPFCNKMEEFTFDDDAVKAAIKKDFIFVNINVKDKGTVTFGNFKGSKLDYVKSVDYEMYPSYLFYDQNGKLVYDEMGYRDEENFLKILKLVTGKAYKDIEN